jgi:uncharacterized FlgJ-related protein
MNDVIQGDSFGTDLPRTQVDESLLTLEKNLAKYSKTKEFKALKEYMEARIAFFQTFMPDGKEVRWDVTPELGTKWVVANNVINEFKAVLNRYEQAAEVVKKVNDVQ